MIDTANNKITLLIKDLKSENYGFKAIDDLVALGASVTARHYENFDKHFVTITLPEGFLLGEKKECSGFKQTAILDENGNVRGYVLINKEDCKISNIHLCNKYGVYTNKKKNGECDSYTTYFGTKDEVLIEGASFRIYGRYNSASYEDSLIIKSREECMRMADEFYPEWRNPNAYWDEEPIRSNEDNLVLARLKKE